MKANDTGLVPCEILKPVKGYNVGEIAGFFPHIAEGLIKQGAAKEVKPARAAKSEE